MLMTYDLISQLWFGISIFMNLDRHLFDNIWLFTGISKMRRLFYESFDKAISLTQTHLI